MAVLQSLALRDIPRPDFADVLVVALAEGDPLDPRRWAEQLFGPTAMPPWLRAAFAARQALVPLIGVPSTPWAAFAVREVSDDEALVAVDDVHLDFRCGVAVLAEQRLLTVTSTVRLHGWRGRLYFLPVRVVHPLAVQTMVAAARRAFARAGDAGAR